MTEWTNKMLIAAFMEMDLPGTGSTRQVRRSKRSAPATIYPEILVIVDYDGYRFELTSHH